MPTPAPARPFSITSISLLTLYPWNGLTGPYDVTTAESLAGLQDLGISINPTLVIGQGGESNQDLFAVETRRTITIKASALIVSLRMYQILLGGNLGVQGPTTGLADQVQVLDTKKGDRAPYFRLVGQSNLNDGLTQVTFPKCKVNGNVDINIQKDTITIPNFSAMVFFDETFSCGDKSLGGATMEIYNSQTGTYTPLT